MDSNIKRYWCMYDSYAFTSESPLRVVRHGLKCLHKNRQCSDTGGKWEETVKSDYDNKLSGLEREPYDVVYQKDGSPSRAVKTSSIIEDDNKGVR